MPRLNTPRGSCLLLAILLLSVMWISRENAWRNNSTVGRFVGKQMRNDRWRLGERPDYLHAKCVVWIGENARLAEPADYYGSPVFYDYEQKDLPLVWLVWRVGATRAGWWAVTHEARWEELVVVNFRKIATPAQIDQAKQLYVAAVPLYPEAASFRVNRYRLVWSGVALDVATVALAVMLFRSLGWISTIGLAKRTERRIAQGVCPKCTYDLSGLTSSRSSDQGGSPGPVTRCPECGEALPRNLE